MRVFTFLTALLMMLLATSSEANPGGAPAVPEKHIPSSVLLELRLLEGQFDLALGRDCAPERCVSKGCVYRDHVVVDLPRATSLPGLPQSEGLGAVPPQEYLTQAACDFAHEKTVSPKDAQALVKRLEQRLSKGWLRVTVGHQILEPVSPALAQSPPEPAPPAPPEPVKPPPPDIPKEWDAKVAARELWVSLLPHFSWMIALFLGTLSALALIWAARRLGRETLEEKALATTLLNEQAQALEPEPAAPEATPPPATVDPEVAFTEQQRALWRERIEQADFGKDGGGLLQLLRDWLREKEFSLLAKAIFLFGDRLSAALPSDGELAARKVEFAEYLKNLEERSLPSDAAFFRVLHQHTISSALLSQSDAETYQSIGGEFGAKGVGSLVTALGQRPGALLFGLVPTELQFQVARTLSRQARLEVSNYLLESNRMSRFEQSYLFQAVDAARAGSPLPEAPVATSYEIMDRGQPFDAAGALGVLLPFLNPGERQALLAQRVAGGALPQWYEDIFFADMLKKLPSPEARTELLLEVDIKALAGWLSFQTAEVREDLTASLPQTFQSALRASGAFGSRGEQLRLARQGQEQFVAALKKQYSRGQVAFADLAG